MTTTVKGTVPVWLGAAIGILIAAFSFSRGFTPSITQHASAYYLVNYHNGLIRRGLIGQILSWFVDQTNFAETMAASAVLYLTVLVLVLALLWLWSVFIEYRRRDWLVISLFCICAASQFIPTTAADAGYLDAYDYLLLLVAALAFVRKQLILASIIGFAGPFLHEPFIFLWLGLAVLVYWDRSSFVRAIALCVPLIATAVVCFGPSVEAGIAQMQSAALPNDLKKAMVTYQFGQTIEPIIQITLWKISHNFLNFLIAIAFFVLPAIIIVAVYGLCRKKAVDAIVVILATGLPLTLIFVAWDLSRFLAPATFFSLVAVLYMETVRPTAPSGRAALLVCWASIVLLVQIPFVYAYVDIAYSADSGVVSVGEMPMGRLIASGVSLYSRNIGPKAIANIGNEEAPGNVWYIEEDAWSGALIRRPGTNVFDATVTKAGQVATYVATITRSGDKVFMSRHASDDKEAIIYVGTLEGNKVRGTYPLGIWIATILR